MSVRVRLRGIGQVGFDIERKLVGVLVYKLLYDAHLDPFYSHNTQGNTFFAFFLDKRQLIIHSNFRYLIILQQKSQG